VDWNYSLLKVVSAQSVVVADVVVTMLYYCWKLSESPQHCYYPCQHLPDLRPLSPETISAPLSDGPIAQKHCFASCFVIAFLSFLNAKINNKTNYMYILYKAKFEKDNPRTLSYRGRTVVIFPAT